MSGSLFDIDELTPDQAMIRDSANDFFSADTGYTQVRAARGVLPGYRPAAWHAMAELGWAAWRTPENLGGAGLGFAEGCLLHEALGKALAPEPLTASAVVATAVLLRSENAGLRASLLAGLAAGTRKATLAWQENGSDETAAFATRVQADAQSGARTLSGRKRFVPVVDAEVFIVAAETADGCELHALARDTAGLAITTRPAIDGTFWAELQLDSVAVGRDTLLVGARAGRDVLIQALDEGRLTVSAELLGLMTQAVAITVEHLLVRKQFGQSLASFQALQHRVVDIAMQTQIARSVVLHGASVFDAEDADAPARSAAASQAKARCSQAAMAVLRGCIQLHGGMGYTEEANIGMFLKRAMVLSQWLGGADQQRQRFVALRPLRGEDSDTASDQDATIGDGVRLSDVRAWIAANFPQEWRLPPHRQSLRETASWQRKLYEQGWAAPNWPVEYGGMGLSAYEMLLFSEEFDRHGINIVPNMGPSMLGPLLIRYGTDEQRERYLGKILRSDEYWCQGYSEPDAGSDLAALRTKATLEGDHFVVNGQKTWTSLASDADMIFLLVRTDPHAKKQEGISFLLVDMKSPGISVSPMRNLTGASEFCNVFFDNVRVPAANLVGPLHGGWTMAKSLLGSERVMIGHPRQARQPLLLLYRYAQTRGLLEDPVFCERFHTLYADLADIELTFIRVVDALRRGRDITVETSLLKIQVSETWQRATEMLRDAAGMEGTLEEMTALEGSDQIHIPNLYYSSLPSSIYGGTNEIQRNILANVIFAEAARKA